MHMGMHGMPFMYATPGMHVFTFNSEDMKGKMDEMKEQLKIHPPIDPEQMERLHQRMKDFDKQFYKDKGAEAPKPPAAPAPKAAPAPAAPQTPQ
jgi:alcohol dehydrogenase class IV